MHNTLYFNKYKYVVSNVNIHMGISTSFIRIYVFVCLYNFTKLYNFGLIYTIKEAHIFMFSCKKKINFKLKAQK